MILGEYNPFPHFIDGSGGGISHVEDCPGCAYAKDFYDFVMRVLDRLEREAGTQEKK